MKFNYILILLVMILCLNYVSAGLSVNVTTPIINKIYGQNTTVSYTITNNEPFSFYNISLENNNIINMPIIPELQSGQSAAVNAIVYSNTASAVKLKIKGFYNANVGIQNKTWLIGVDFYNGQSLCDFSIIKGDKVQFINSVPDDITLRNAITNNDITTIYRNLSYTANFDNPETFKYYFLRRGFTFGSICTITALPDTGLINNPQLDGNLNLTLSIIFNPTVMSATITQRNFSIPVFTQQDGVLTVTNIGNDTARSVSMSSDWFTFSANGFDLSPGQTKGIIYTIRPSITKTDQTNQTYDKILKITGNFADMNEHFYINIPFAYVNNSNITSNYQGLIGMLQAYCKDNPKESFCINAPQVVYVGNNTDNEFNVTFSQEQVRKLQEYQFQQGDNLDVFSNYVKDSMDSLNEKSNITASQTQAALEKITQLEEENKRNSSTTTFLIIFTLALSIGTLLGSLIYIYKRYNDRMVVKEW